MTVLYPLFVDLENRLAVVVGAGQIAARKIESLVETGACIRVVSPDVCEEIVKMAEVDRRIELCRHQYESSSIEEAWLVIAATDDRQINTQVYKDCNQRRILCNVVDQPDLCSFQVPSVLQRGQLQIAVSTSGISPALARRIRQRLEGMVSRHYGEILEGLKELREQVKTKYPEDQIKRSEILKGFVNSQAIDMLEQGDLEGFRQILNKWMAK